MTPPYFFSVSFSPSAPYFLRSFLAAKPNIHSVGSSVTDTVTRSFIPPPLRLPNDAPVCMRGTTTRSRRSGVTPFQGFSQKPGHPPRCLEAPWAPGRHPMWWGRDANRKGGLNPHHPSPSKPYIPRLQHQLALISSARDFLWPLVVGPSRGCSERPCRHSHSSQGGSPVRSLEANPFEDSRRTSRPPTPGPAPSHAVLFCHSCLS